LGAPPDAKLLKRVAAQAGDRICAEGDQIRLPSRSVTALAHDRQGRALPRWTGCQVLASDQAFLLGDSEGSFDSRYFGPVARTDLDGVFRGVLTW
jgi:type IV secretory pathway protease TraF